MPLFFLGLIHLSLLKRFHIPHWLPAALASASLAVYIGGMYLSYHVNCGSQYYTPGLCYQPNYKNWAPNDLFSGPLSEELSLRQEVVVECNGMSEFRVWMDASNSDPNGLTVLTLTDVQGDRELARLESPNSELPRKSWLVLTFPPEWNSVGRFYVSDLRAEQGVGPRLAYSLKHQVGVE